MDDLDLQICMVVKASRNDQSRNVDAEAWLHLLEAETWGGHGGKMPPLDFFRGGATPPLNLRFEPLPPPGCELGHGEEMASPQETPQVRSCLPPLILLKGA